MWAEVWKQWSFDVQKSKDSNKTIANIYENRDQKVEDRDLWDNRHREQLGKNRERNKKINDRSKLIIDRLKKDINESIEWNPNSWIKERDIAIEKRDKLNQEIVVERQLKEVDAAYKKIQEWQEELINKIQVLKKSINKEQINTDKEKKEMYPHEYSE